MQVNINFVVTESAAKEMKKAMEESQLSDHVVRVSVQSGGCSGLTYGLEFEEKTQIKPEDVVEQFNDLTVVVDKKSVLLLDGTTVDWVDDVNQKGFKFNNPNVKRSCGCNKVC